MATMRWGRHQRHHQRVHDAEDTRDVKAQYGSRNTPKVDFLTAHVWGKLGVAVDGNVFDTDGYPIVRANERGKVDNNAAVGVLELEFEGGSTRRANVCMPSRESDTSTRIATTARPARSIGTEEANDTIWRG